MQLNKYNETINYHQQISINHILVYYNTYSPFHCFWTKVFCAYSVNMEPIPLKFEIYYKH